MSLMRFLDRFPTTQRSFIDAALAVGRVETARNHVMERSYEPLCVYARASSLRRIADAEDLVGGFFASRFARDEYLAQWLALSSAMPLRRWLVNGLLFYAREFVAEERRAKRATELVDPSTAIESAPWRALETAWRDGVLQCACDRVCEIYASEGRADAWRLFLRHVIDGVAYPLLATELAIPAARAPMITRTALRRLRSEIDAILSEEFTDPLARAAELNAILFDDGDARD